MRIGEGIGRIATVFVVIWGFFIAGILGLLALVLPKPVLGGLFLIGFLIWLGVALFVAAAGGTARYVADGFREPGKRKKSSRVLRQQAKEHWRALKERGLFPDKRRRGYYHHHHRPHRHHYHARPRRYLPPRRQAEFGPWR